MGSRSLGVVLNKFTLLTGETSPRTSDYTMGDLRQEYVLNAHDLAIAADVADESVVGRRWRAELAKGKLNVECEVTTYDDTARAALIEAGLRSKALAATVWFSEHVGEMSEEGGRFSFWASLFEGDANDRYSSGHGEINGDLSLPADLSYKDEALLLRGAGMIGAQRIFRHFKSDALASTKTFFVEIPQTVGSDMVRSAGNLAVRPELSQGH